MLNAQISFRAEYSKIFILCMRVLRFIQTGVMLHLMGVLGLVLFFVFFEKALLAIHQQNMGAGIVYSYLTLHCFTLPFFSQLDARSRYQNYKMLKDKLFIYGYDDRLIRPFIYSRCQRDAVKVAAKELGFMAEFETSVHKMGFRWYHLLPHMVIKSPKLLLTQSYWQKTLFVKAYKSNYFLW